MSDDHTRIPVAGPPQITEARLYDETVSHITEEHTEVRLQLPTVRAGFEQAIANPSRLYDSTTDPGKSVLLVSEALTFWGDPLHIPVKIVDGTSGRVKTAYFSSDTPGGELLWSAGDA
jgi:hypothetical protein